MFGLKVRFHLLLNISFTSLSSELVKKYDTGKNGKKKCDIASLQDNGQQTLTY